MAKSIEPKLKKIGEYLKLEEDTVFTIPEYQRAYSWDINNCDKLWQDIIDYIELGNKDGYFFGTIIINCQDNDTKLDLIDGQQRTTTFLLLLKALLVKINYALKNTVQDDDSAALFRGLQERRRSIMSILYKIDKEDIPNEPDQVRDAEICHRGNIVENHSINENYPDELANILHAIDLDEALTNAKTIKYKRNDNKYTNFIKNYKHFSEKVKELSEPKLNTVAKAIVESCEVIEIKSWNVEQAIKMFNSLNSDGLPLFDSDIISAQLYAEAKQQGVQEEYIVLWKQLNDSINDLSTSGIADINSILMQYMYYVRTISKETISETGAINVTTPGLRRYFINDKREWIRNPIKMCNEMQHLVTIWEKVSDYSLIKLLLKFNENSKLFLASYFFRLSQESIVKEDLFTLLECMLRLFVVLEIVDAGYSSKYFKTFLFGEEVKLIDKSIPLEEIKDDFNVHICTNWERTKIIEALKDYNGNLLVYLNEYLFAKEKGLVFKLGSKYDIEHIMPHSGNNLSEIRNDAEIGSEEEFESVVNKLGNKILLEEKINRSIGNEWFRTKVSTTLEKKTGYIDSSYPIACALVDTYKNVPKPYWTKDDIIAATEKASERIADFIFGEQ